MSEIIRKISLLVTGLGALAGASVHALAHELPGAKVPEFDLSSAIVVIPDTAIAGERKPGLDALISPAADEGSSQSFADRYFRRIETPELGPYDISTFVRQTASVPLEFAALNAIPLYHGLDKWNWGKSEFHFTSEGWFGRDTKYLGIDKLGHVYGTYLYADFLTQRIAQKNSSRTGAAITGSLLAMAIQTGVEIGDGFSPDYGFSQEDLIADGLGAGFSLLRNAVPGLADKLDFRMEYWKSDYSSFDPTTDYDGQKYILALKLGGFEQFQNSPLRFFELQAGYFARGIGEEAVANGVKRRREPYAAIGLNLNALVRETPARDSAAVLLAGRVLEYVQPPYTYLPSKWK